MDFDDEEYIDIRKLSEEEKLLILRFGEESIRNPENKSCGIKKF